MKVRELMTSLVHSCSPQDSLTQAARMMWDHDCGALPVVDRNGKVGAMITDRDICMAAYTRGERLSDLRVADSMSKSLVSCSPDDELSIAAARMAEHRVHRLPVIDTDGKLSGILSLNNIAAASNNTEIGREALKALMGVCRSDTVVVAVDKAPATRASASKGKATAAGST